MEAINELVQKAISLIKDLLTWANDSAVFSWLIDFIKTLGNIVIKIFQFFIDVIKWVIDKI